MMIPSPLGSWLVFREVHPDHVVKYWVLSYWWWDIYGRRLSPLSALFNHDVSAWYGRLDGVFMDEALEIAKWLNEEGWTWIRRGYAAIYDHCRSNSFARPS